MINIYNVSNLIILHVFESQLATLIYENVVFTPQVNSYQIIL
jgi:hypothetical protein